MDKMRLSYYFGGVPSDQVENKTYAFHSDCRELSLVLVEEKINDKCEKSLIVEPDFSFGINYLRGR